MRILFITLLCFPLIFSCSSNDKEELSPSASKDKDTNMIITDEAIFYVDLVIKKNHDSEYEVSVLDLRTVTHNSENKVTTRILGGEGQYFYLVVNQDGLACELTAQTLNEFLAPFLGVEFGCDESDGISITGSDWGGIGLRKIKINIAYLEFAREAVENDPLNSLSIEFP